MSAACLRRVFCNEVCGIVLQGAVIGHEIHTEQLILAHQTDPIVQAHERRSEVELKSRCKMSRSIQTRALRTRRGKRPGPSDGFETLAGLAGLAAGCLT